MQFQIFSFTSTLKHKNFISGNGYIEGTELDGFLREFVSSANITDVGPEVSNNYPSDDAHIKLAS